ncbi:MAG: GGDEF domain-containing protein, partial [Arenimonas sp.]
NKNKVLQLEQTVAKQKERYTALLVALLLVLLGALIYWSYRTKRMQLAFQHLAQTDALTGISNRDHFNKNAEHALAEAVKKSEQIGMIMFDLDNFKSINDRFGHSVGDWVLRHVIEVCKPICRKGDCIGRIGGEEFAILLHAIDLESATAMAERFREKIAAIDTSATGKVFVVTASFGVTTTKYSGYAFDALLLQADEALYQSKNSGRDRVNVFNVKTSTPFYLPESAPAV